MPVLLLSLQVPLPQSPLARSWPSSPPPAITGTSTGGLEPAMRVWAGRPVPGRVAAPSRTSLEDRSSTRSTRRVLSTRVTLENRSTAPVPVSVTVRLNRSVATAPIASRSAWTRSETPS